MYDLYTFTVPVFVRSLTALKGLMQKVEAEALEKGMDTGALLQERLAPDMFPLVKQVQVATDHAKGCGARLSNIENPKFEDIETTFAELYTRIDKTLAFLATLSPTMFEGAEERMYTLPYLPEGKGMKVLEYTRDYALPNFFFHYITAYDIMRHKGFEIGKGDFMGGWPELHDLA